MRATLRPMKRLSILFLLLLPAITACNSEKPAASLDPFPLHAGNYWIYKGQVKWSDATKAEGGVAEATMTWKMEVVRTMKVGRYDVAVMKGHPSDLAWYEKDKPRSDYLIVRDGTKYYRVDDVAIPDAAALEPKLDFNSIFLEIPPPQGCIARDPEIRRDDTMYCWVSGDAKKIRFEGIVGVSPEKEVITFEFAMRTNPEHAIVTFAQGIGVTSYIYVHHGTVSEVDVKLIEFLGTEYK